MMNTHLGFGSSKSLGQRFKHPSERLLIVLLCALGTCAATMAQALSSGSVTLASGSNTSFPATAIGSSSGSQIVQFQLNTATAISSITVSPALNGKVEFALGSVSGCVTNGSTSNLPGSICSVTITFQPQYPGLRESALTVNNGAGVVGTVGLSGLGLGPEISLVPGTASVWLGGGIAVPSATPEAALDASLNLSGEATGAPVFDGPGNYYFLDVGHGLVEKVDTQGRITAVCGGGTTSPTPDPTPGLQVKLQPSSLASDSAGNLYIVDSIPLPGGKSAVNVVEKWVAASGTLSVIAGGGNTAATSTPLNALAAAIMPVSVAADSAGNVYLLDRYAAYWSDDETKIVVDKIDPATGAIQVIAGGGATPPGNTPEAGLAAQLVEATGITLDQEGDLIIADYGNNLVETLNTATTQIVAIAGGGVTLPAPAPLPVSKVAIAPTVAAVNAQGDIFVADGGPSRTVDEIPHGSNQIFAIAGGGTSKLGWMPQPATSVSICPGDIKVDQAGNLYIADNGDTSPCTSAGPSFVAKLSAGTNQLVAIAGGGTIPPGTTPLSAASAQLTNIGAVAVDTAGNVYIDASNLLYRMDAHSSNIALVPNVPPLQAGTDLEFDGSGNLYFIEGTVYNPLDMYNPVTGVVSQVPGTSAVGTYGGIALTSGGPLLAIVNYNNLSSNTTLLERVSNGQLIPAAGGGSAVPAYTPEGASAAEFSTSLGRFGADAAGNIYIPDIGNRVLDDVNLTTGRVVRIAGVGNDAYPDSTPKDPLSVRLIAPDAVTVDGAGNIYISNLGINGREVDEISATSGQIVALPISLRGYTDQSGEELQPRISADASGNLFWSDPARGAIVQGSHSSSQLSIIAGGGNTPVGAAPESVAEAEVAAGPIAIDGAGHLVLASPASPSISSASTADIDEIDSAANQIRKRWSGSDPCPRCTYLSPHVCGLAVDAANNVYFDTCAYSNDIIRVDATTGASTLIAGGGLTAPGTSPVPATSIQFGAAAGLAISDDGDVYVADAMGTVDKIDARSGESAVISGGGTAPVTSTPASATSVSLAEPVAVALDSKGNLYIADNGDSTRPSTLIEKIDTTGQISAIAGGGSTPMNQWPVSATSTTLEPLQSMAVDAAGNVYATAPSTGVYRIDAGTGLIRLVGGTAGIPAPASALAAIAGPSCGLALDPAGAIYISDCNRFVTRIVPEGMLQFGSVLTGQPSPAATLTAINVGNRPLSISAVTSGADFPLQSNSSCGTAQSLATGDTCDLLFEFAPSAAGTLNEEGTISDDSLNIQNSTQMLSLSGSAETPTPSAMVQPWALSFAPTWFGATTEAGVTISNNGTAPLVISTVSATGDFSTQANCPSAGLPAGAQCGISVVYAPQSTTGSVGTLTISENGSQSHRTVALTGEPKGIVFGGDTARSVSAGKSATFHVVLADVNATATYARACTGAPTAANCTPDPPSVDLSNGNRADIQVTVTTTARSLALPVPSHDQYLWLWPIVMLLTAGMASRWRPLRWAEVGLLCVSMAACGSGGGQSTGESGAPPPAATGTSAGTYSLTLTATNGSITQSEMLKLTVQ